MYLLGCFTLLLFIVVALLMLAPVILLNVVRRLFGGAKQKARTNTWGRTDQESSQQHTHTSSSTRNARKGKKIFNSGEGEYVEFEEVKD